MPSDVLAATLVAPGRLELQRFPYPERLEPGAVLIEMLASGICGTDKHTFRGETQQYAGTDHASSTPFPIIQGHENVGVVVAIGDGGATAFDGTPARRSAIVVVPAPNRACGECEYCRGDFPYYFCRRLENYGNSLTCAEPPHLFGGWARVPLPAAAARPCSRFPTVSRRTWQCSPSCSPSPTASTWSAQMPRPGGFRSGDTVAVVGIGPVGIVHVAKAGLIGASRVIAIDPFEPRAGTRHRARRDRHPGRERRRRERRGVRARRHATDVVSMWSSTPPVIRPASCRRCRCSAMAER